MELPAWPRNPRVQQLLSLLGFLALVLVCGCVEVRGRYYWMWNEPLSAAESSCVTVQPGTGSLIHVAVLDEAGLPLPGVKVLFTRLQPKAVAPYETSPDGLVNAWLEPGDWQVDAQLSGFFSGRVSTKLLIDHTCSVVFHLQLKSDEFTVA